MSISVGVVKIAEDADFKHFKEMCESTEGWRLEVNKHKTMVWTKVNDLSSFNMVKVSKRNAFYFIFCHSNFFGIPLHEFT